MLISMNVFVYMHMVWFMNVLASENVHMHTHMRYGIVIAQVVSL